MPCGGLYNYITACVFYTISVGFYRLGINVLFLLFIPSGLVPESASKMAQTGEG